MKNTDIKKVYYNDNEVIALYWGNNPIYVKEEGNNKHSISGIWSNSPISYERDYDGKPYIIYNYNRIDNIPINDDKSFGYDLNNTLTDASYMFANATFNSGNNYPSRININYNLTNVDISNIDFTNTVNCEKMFYNCQSLTTIKGLNKLGQSNNLTKITEMFGNCKELTSVDISNITSEKINGYNIFYQCKNLINVKLPTSRIIVTVNGGGASGMFYGCEKLENINWMNIYFNSSQYRYSDFGSCFNLKNIYGYYEGVNFNLSLGNSPLTNASAMVFINGLSNVTEVKTITFKQSTYDTLTNEQIALATSKGWSVVCA